MTKSIVQSWPIRWGLYQLMYSNLALSLVDRGSPRHPNAMEWTSGTWD